MPDSIYFLTATAAALGFFHSLLGSRPLSLQKAADAARRPHGAIELEIVEGQVRFRIGRGIWREALTFEQACGRFEGRG